MQVIITAKELSSSINLLKTVSSAIGKEEAMKIRIATGEAKRVIAEILTEGCGDQRKVELVEKFNSHYASKEGVVSIYMDSQGNLVTDYKEQAIIDVIKVVEDEAEFFVTTGLMVIQFLKMVKGRMSSLLKRIEEIESSYATKAE